jgi:hypothetical protein
VNNLRFVENEVSFVVEVVDAPDFIKGIIDA